MKKIIVSLMLAMGFMSASAQEQQPQTENVFNPHWFVQVQGGAQYTLGELSFGDLISPNVQVSGGYNFTKLFGLRLSINAWQSKAGGEYNVFGPNGEGYEYSWSWNYINPNVDAILDLSNLIGGYNPNRLFSVKAFAGLGVNVAFNNDEAAAAKAEEEARIAAAKAEEIAKLRAAAGIVDPAPAKPVETAVSEPAAAPAAPTVGEAPMRPAVRPGSEAAPTRPAAKPAV